MFQMSAYFDRFGASLINMGQACRIINWPGLDGFDIQAQHMQTEPRQTVFVFEAPPLFVIYEFVKTRRIRMLD